MNSRSGHRERWVLYNTVNFRFVDIRAHTGELAAARNIITWSANPNGLSLSYHEYFETIPKFTFQKRVKNDCALTGFQFHQISCDVDLKISQLGPLCDIVCVSYKRSTLNFANIISWCEMKKFYEECELEEFRK